MSAYKYLQFDLVEAFMVLCNAHRDVLSSKRLLEGQTPSQQGEAILLRHAARMIDDAKYLLEQIAQSPSARPSALSSFSADLVRQLSPARPGTVTFDIKIWRSLTGVLRPEEFELLVSRGLGLGPDLPKIFGALDEIPRSSTARDIARIIGRDIGSAQQYRNQGKIIWFDPGVKTLRSPLFAPWMKAQVQAFPDDTLDIIGTAKVTSEIDTLLKFYLAGAPTQFFKCDAPYTKAVRDLLGKMTSNHGKLEITALTGDLEHYLSGPPIEKIPG